MGSVEQRAAYRWMVERGGVTVLSEHDVHGTEHYLREIPAAPYRFHAVSASGPCVYIDIDQGMERIWEHRVRDSVNIFSGDRRIEDCVIIGRRRADGHEEVMLIYPDGQHFEFSGLMQARAHSR